MLCPEIGHVGLFDLHQFDSCLEAGVAAVHEHEAELIGWREKTAQSPDSPSVWEKSRGQSDSYLRNLRSWLLPSDHGGRVCRLVGKQGQR
jgi:hypothetical protein